MESGPAINENQKHKTQLSTQVIKLEKIIWENSQKKEDTISKLI